MKHKIFSNKKICITFYLFFTFFTQNFIPQISPINSSGYKSGANKKLIYELKYVFSEDQKYRNLIDPAKKKYGVNSVEIKRLWDTINKKDKTNLSKVTTILDEYGWLGPEIIGEEGNTTLFLVIQHANLKIQEKYLPMMREAVKKRSAYSRHLALLEDRVAVGNGKKQIYGSQLRRDSITGKFTLEPIDDEINVNKRRASVGLEPLEEYVKQWGIVYKSGMSNSIINNPHTIGTSFSETHRTLLLITIGLLVFIFLIYLIMRLKKRKVP